MRTSVVVALAVALASICALLGCTSDAKSCVAVTSVDIVACDPKGTPCCEGYTCTTPDGGGPRCTGCPAQGKPCIESN
jgi:hypothetical protein